MSYWIGVAVKDHVMAGVRGGFCQLGHGKHKPVKRLCPGDWLVYYASRTALAGGEKVQAFVALGQVQSGEPYQVQMSSHFSAWRRDVAYRAVHDAPVRPLLTQLRFIDDVKHWGIQFRRSVFEISRQDFTLIGQAMGVDPETL